MREANNDSRLLEWDSEQLGFPCFVAEHTINPQSLQNLQGLTVIRVPDVETSQLRILLCAGSTYIGTELLLQWKDESSEDIQKYPGAYVKISKCCPEVFEDFLNEVPLTRFLLDKRIPFSLSQKLWKASFKNQCQADPHVSDMCATLYVDGEAAGIWTLKEQNNIFSTPFIGIIEKFRNRGLGKYFMAETIRKLTPYSMTSEVFSQNIASLLMHQRANFLVVGARHILHYLKI